MAEPRVVRPPKFLDDKPASTPAVPASFTRLSSPRAGPLRVLTPPRPRPPPTPPPSETPPPVSALGGAEGAPAAPPTPAPPPEAGAGGLPSPPSAMLAGILGPAAPRAEGGAGEGLQRLEAAVERLRLESSRLADQARADALEIGFQVARRLLEQELTSNPDALFALVRSAVRRLGDARRLVIRLHPVDAARVDAPEGRKRLGLSLMQVEVTPDPSLQAGDCVIESETVTVDGRLSTRLEELHRAAESALEEGGG